MCQCKGFNSNTSDLGVNLNRMLNESSLCRGCEAGDEEDGHVLRVGSVEGKVK
jgi:hypothetical protein